MAYSKRFNSALDDAISRARWRVEVHQRDMLPTEREKETARIGDMSKTLIVTYDMMEKFIVDVLVALDEELARRNNTQSSRSKVKSKTKRRGK